VKKIGKFVQILVLDLLYKILLCMETKRNWSILVFLYRDVSM